MDAKAKERPILFSGEMVRAILEGRKTQTRRLRGLEDVNKKPDIWTFNRLAQLDWMTRKSFKGRFGAYFESNQVESRTLTIAPQHCPYGQPGDRLWVRETFALDGSLFYRADGGMTHADLETVQKTKAEWKWRPSIHMPRAFSRIALGIVAVRVERLRAITEADAEAEGIHLSGLPVEERYNHPRKHIVAFAEIWDLINAKRGYPWESNPWVWVIEFRLAN